MNPSIVELELSVPLRLVGHPGAIRRMVRFRQHISLDDRAMTIGRKDEGSCREGVPMLMSQICRRFPYNQNLRRSDFFFFLEMDEFYGRLIAKKLSDNTKLLFFVNRL